jgi:hypothetical protein
MPLPYLPLWLHIIKCLKAGLMGQSGRNNIYICMYVCMHYIIYIFQLGYAYEIGLNK